MLEEVEENDEEIERLIEEELSLLSEDDLLDIGGDDKDGTEIQVCLVFVKKRPCFVWRFMLFFSFLNSIYIKRLNDNLKGAILNHNQQSEFW